jgi:hypothetical protein
MVGDAILVARLRGQSLAPNRRCHPIEEFDLLIRRVAEKPKAVEAYQASSASGQYDPLSETVDFEACDAGANNGRGPLSRYDDVIPQVSSHLWIRPQAVEVVYVFHPVGPRAESGRTNLYVHEAFDR